MFLPGRRKPSHRPNKKNGRKNSMTLIKQRLKISPIKNRTTPGPPFDRRRLNGSLLQRGGSWYRQAAGAVALDSTLQSGLSISWGMSLGNDPEYWRKRAEEARAAAVQMMDAHTKAIMLSIAQDYEKLAKRAEQRAAKPL